MLLASGSPRFDHHAIQSRGLLLTQGAPATQLSRCPKARSQNALTNYQCHSVLASSARRMSENRPASHQICRMLKHEDIVSLPDCRQINLELFKSLPRELTLRWSERIYTAREADCLIVDRVGYAAQAPRSSPPFDGQLLIMRMRGEGSGQSNLLWL